MTRPSSSQADTRYVDGTSARFAYRRFGVETGVPLVMALRFRGTMDHWDPAFLDRLATERDVIIFDNIGHAKTDGAAPNHDGGVGRRSGRVRRCARAGSGRSAGLVVGRHRGAGGDAAAA